MRKFVFIVKPKQSNVFKRYARFNSSSNEAMRYMLFQNL